jgi:hypothetical protein
MDIGTAERYVIIQNRIEPDENGVPKITEVLLAHPDTEENAKRRIMKWKASLEMQNLRLRRAVSEDYPKKHKRKRGMKKNVK